MLSGAEFLSQPIFIWTKKTAYPMKKWYFTKSLKSPKGGPVGFAFLILSNLNFLLVTCWPKQIEDGAA